MKKEELWQPYVKQLDSMLIQWGDPQYDVHQIPCYSIDELHSNIRWLKKYIPEEELDQTLHKKKTSKQSLNINEDKFERKTLPITYNTYSTLYFGVYDGKDVVAQVFWEEQLYLNAVNLLR